MIMRMGSGTVCTCGRSSKRSPPGGAFSLVDEMAELKGAVRRLQRESAEQLKLEVETQATFEHLGDQVSGFQRSLALLADVTMQEMHELKAWVRRRTDEIMGKAERHVEDVEAMRRELASLRRATDEMNRRLQDEAVVRSREIGRLDCVQNTVVEGMQEARKTQTVASKSLSEDVTGLQELVDQVAQAQNRLTREMADVQRAVKQSQVQTTTRSGEESTSRLSSELAVLRSRVSSVEGVVERLKVDTIETREELKLHRRDTSARFLRSQELLRGLGVHDLPDG